VKIKKILSTGDWTSLEEQINTKTDSYFFIDLKDWETVNVEIKYIKRNYYLNLTFINYYREQSVLNWVDNLFKSKSKVIKEISNILRSKWLLEINEELYNEELYDNKKWYSDNLFNDEDDIFYIERYSMLRKLNNSVNELTQKKELTFFIFDTHNNGYIKEIFDYKKEDKSPYKINIFLENGELDLWYEYKSLVWVRADLSNILKNYNFIGNDYTSYISKLRNINKLPYLFEDNIQGKYYKILLNLKNTNETLLFPYIY